MQETKYGTTPIDEILKDGMLHGFERMCIVYESIVAMVCHFFSIYIDVYYLILQFSHWCILFNIAIFIILTNVYTLIIVYFYFCRWKVKKKKTINTDNKTFLKITQVVEVALAVTTVQVKNDDHYVWISKQGVVFFEKCLWN